MSTGMFFVGTSKSLGLENSPTMILIGLCILGASWAIMTIPVLPEMKEAVETRPDLNYDEEELDNYMSGLFVVSTGIGEAIGPMMSSTLYDAYGFRDAADILAFIAIIYACIYFMFVGNFKMFLRTRKERGLTE